MANGILPAIRKESLQHTCSSHALQSTFTQDHLRNTPWNPHPTQSEPSGEAPEELHCLYYSCFTAQKAAGRATAGVRPGSSVSCSASSAAALGLGPPPRAKMAGAACTASSRLRGFTGRKWPLALAHQLSSEKQHFLISNSTRHSVCPAKTK